MNKPHFYRNFFLTDWRHERLKNTIDLLLFHGEDFYGFSESVKRNILDLLKCTSMDFSECLIFGENPTNFVPLFLKKYIYFVSIATNF